MKTINLYAGKSSSGNRVYENLPAHSLGDDIYQLLASPGLVPGTAKGDEIRWDVHSGEFIVLSRGQQVCVQLFLPPNPGKCLLDLIKRVEGELSGTLDGQSEKQAVFSIPVASGFKKIEEAFHAYVQINPDSEWFYGNVYDAKDGTTPLNWWNLV